MNTNSPQAPPEILTLSEAAAYLRMHPNTLRQKADAGVIPGGKIGKEWRFVKPGSCQLGEVALRWLSAGGARHGGGKSMSLRKRGEIWHVDIASPNGDRVRQSAETADRQEAQEFHDRLKADLWRSGKLGDRQSHTWEEAVVRYLKETEHKASRRDDLRYFRDVDRFFRGRSIAAITGEMIQKTIAGRRQAGHHTAANRALALVRSVLNQARGWGWLDRVPVVKLTKEPASRIRWIAREDATKLLAELPDHLRVMVAFTLATGLRQANVTGLEWGQIDMERRTAWIHPDQAKARRAIAIPLNGDALEILRGQAGRHPRFVFTWKGNQVKQTNTLAWRKALERAGIANFRWHDLRHTWASWHIQAGTPTHVLQELGGWESVEMVRRYAHLGSQHLAPFAGAVALGHGTNPSQAKLRLVANNG